MSSIDPRRHGMMPGVLLGPIADEIEEVEQHIHNITHTFGLRAIPTATLWGDLETLTPYELTSGLGAWGGWAQLIGAGDTPVRPGKTHYDPHRINYLAASEANIYRVQFAYGTTTPADALAAGQVASTSVTPPNALGPGAGGAPTPTTQMRIAVGTQLWARTANANNGATITLMVEIHEYPAGP